jgi:X-Pro dipeptidyl-peptidase
VPIAGVTNQWRNMFLNGVPYHGRFYPLTYEATEGAPPPMDVTRGPAWLLNAAAGACEQEEMLSHIAPTSHTKGVYDEYWAERNFTTRVKDINASVFYVQGFIDRAVNPMESIYWFNEMDVPKKAFLGQWPHMLADREDWEDTLLAWFDHWLKGIDTGIMDTPTVEIVTNLDTIRVASEWPPTDAVPRAFWLGAGALTGEAPADASESYRALVGADFLEDAESIGAPGTAPNGLRFQAEPLDAPLHMAGSAVMHLRASVDAENTYFLCSLYDVNDAGVWYEVSEGWMNAHLHEGFDKSSPLTPGETYSFDFRFEPREYVFEAGHSVGLRIKGHDSRVFPVDQIHTTNTVVYGAEGSWLELPTLDAPVTYPRPDGV